jgi:hypothetical protein
MADMPDAAAGRKRQIRGLRILRYLRTPTRPGSLCFGSPAQICCAHVANAAQIRQPLLAGNHRLGRFRRGPGARLFHLDHAIYKNAVPQVWISVARRIGSRCAAVAAGFILSLPDKGFLQTHPRAAGTCVPKMGQVISARNRRRPRPGPLNDSAVIAAGSDRCGTREALTIRGDQAPERPLLRRDSGGVRR